MAARPYGIVAGGRRAARVAAVVLAMAGAGCDDLIAVGGSACPPPPTASVGGSTPVPYDADVADDHEQIDHSTCLPMAVELVLKLKGRVPPTFYELQLAARYCSGRQVGDYDGRRVGGFTFHQRLSEAHGPTFSMPAFERVVDGELAAGRLVVVGLPVGHDGEFACRPMPDAIAGDLAAGTALG